MTRASGGRRKRWEIVRPDGMVALSIPLRDRQLVEVNWFSRWGQQGPESISERRPGEPQCGCAGVGDGDTGAKGGGQEVFRIVQRWHCAHRAGDDTLKDLSPTPFDANPVPEVGFTGI